MKNHKLGYMIFFNVNYEVKCKTCIYENCGSTPTTLQFNFFSIRLVALREIEINRPFLFKLPTSDRP